MSDLRWGRHVEAVAQTVTRRRIVFVQCGALFAPYRRDLLKGMPGAKLTVAEFLAGQEESPPGNMVTISDLEVFIGSTTEYTLGELREAIFSKVDEGSNVCLLSRAPRVAYGDVVGSSLLEDAATHFLPLVSESDLPDAEPQPAGWVLPVIAMQEITQLEAAYSLALRELGTEVLGGLDHALYELHPRSTEGLNFLGRREIEALRGAGIVVLDEQHQPSLAVPNRLTTLKDAIADTVSQMTAPPSDLASITAGLWYIERTIRLKLRAAAIDKAGVRWRGEVVSGSLGGEVLRRARLDTGITAASARELRDPTEWLTLGELLDLVTSKKYDNLSVDPIVWRRFSEQLVPIRNRLSHMRFTKNGDQEVVSMWAGIIRQHLGA